MKNSKSKTEAAPEVAPQVVTENKEAKTIKFVVVRDGYRVSDKDYENANDPVAVAEQEFWSRIATKFSHGEPVQIVQFESKKHRVW